MSVKPPPIFAPISFLKNRLFTHSVFWGIYLSVVLIGSIGNTYIKYYWRVFALDLIINITYAYGILLVLIPYLLYQSRILSFIAACVGWTMVVCYIELYVMKVIYSDTPDEISILKVTDYVPIYILTLFLVTAIKFGKDLLLIQHEAELAQRDKIQQELNFLRAQLSPHFLLNTMNNLYGLSVIKSDELPKLMLRLSDLLRYTIYDTKTDKVPLKDEIEYLLDYIELQKIRMSAKVNLTVDFPSDIPPNWHVAPLLLIVFVENAFKHSQNMVKTTERYMRFKINIQDDIFTFMSENTFENEPAFGQNKENNIALRHEGIGLETTLRRIELIYGKDNLPRITKDNGVYRVELTLKNAK
jgi:two-component system, LytTR family, sensor histidine kinase LytS